MDFDLYKQLNGPTSSSDALEAVARFFAENGQFALLLLLGGLFLARGRWKSQDGRQAAAVAGFSVLLALGASQLLTKLWDRPRPYEAHPGESHLLVPRSQDPSFPSDHATGAFAIAIAILLHHRKAGVPALVLAFLISISRVAVGTHYPSDVLGGAVLGGLVALALWSPPAGVYLHRLADWAGDLYDRLMPGTVKADDQPADADVGG